MEVLKRRRIWKLGASHGRGLKTQSVRKANIHDFIMELPDGYDMHLLVNVEQDFPAEENRES